MMDFNGKDIIKLEYDRTFENQHYLAHFKNRIKLNVVIFILVVGFLVLDKIVGFNFSPIAWKIVGWILIALVLFFFYNFFYVLVVPMNFAFHKPIYIIDERAILYGNYAELNDGTSRGTRVLIAMKIIFNKINSVDISRSFIVIRGDITRKVYNNRIKSENSASVIPSSSASSTWEEIVDEKLDMVRIPRKFINEEQVLKYLKP